MHQDSTPEKSRFLGLIESLELLRDQCRAYQRALPTDNYAARAAIAALGELARQALIEANDLAESFSPTIPPGGMFSPRQRQVLVLVAEGLTNKEIAYRLGVSERTVQFHLNTIFNKCGANSRTEAVAMALRNGWLED